MNINLRYRRGSKFASPLPMISMLYFMRNECHKHTMIFTNDLLNVRPTQIQKELYWTTTKLYMHIRAIKKNIVHKVITKHNKDDILSSVGVKKFMGFMPCFSPFDHWRFHFLLFHSSSYSKLNISYATIPIDYQANAAFSDKSNRATALMDDYIKSNE